MMEWVQWTVGLLVWLGSLATFIFKFGQQKESIDSKINKLILEMHEERKLNKTQEEKLNMISHLEEKLRLEKEMNTQQESKFNQINDMLHVLKENNSARLLDYVRDLGKLEKQVGEMQIKLDHLNEKVNHARSSH